MDLYEALYTTRAMRRVKPDPISVEIQDRILDAAIRAPSGGNSQDWRFLMVDDAEVIGRVAPLYQECIAMLWSSIYNERIEAANADPEAEESKQMLAIQRSVDYAAANFSDYPLLMFAFSRGDSTGGSIYPAVWSAQLAARAEGVGSSLTSVLLLKGDEVPNLLGVPTDEGWQMAGMVPMGYPKGRWGVAKRAPVHEVGYRNRWGNPVTTIDEPLWSPEAG